jgi:hypothetical protein
MNEQDFIVSTSRVVIEVTDTLKVTPEDAVIKKGSCIEWLVERLDEGQLVEINFHVKGDKAGPFRPEGTLGNPRRGRYTTKQGTLIRTSVADQIGYWKYDVILRTPGREDVAVDPGIMIKEG